MIHLSTYTHTYKHIPKYIRICIYRNIQNNMTTFIHKIHMPIISYIYTTYKTIHIHI